MANNQLLPPTTIMGVVSLKVGNLKTMSEYYSKGVGLQVISDNKDNIMLGENGTPVLLLEYAPELKHAPAGSAGLFHTAILYKAPSKLAQAVYSLLTNYSHSYTGSADHLVSRAFYFDDPEGNGLELYVDYPRDKWHRFGDHGVHMDTLALDTIKFLKDNLPEAKLEGHPLYTPQLFHVRSSHNEYENFYEETAALNGIDQSDSLVGHVHLKVGNINTAKDFYADKLGFEVTMEFGSQAIFFSSGGYHHHIAANTWYSNSAGPRTPSLGLGQVSILLPNAEDIDVLSEKLNYYNVQLKTPEEKTLEFNDPWLNSVTVKVQSKN